jgi:hypothetical protein
MFIHMNLQSLASGQKEKTQIEVRKRESEKENIVYVYRLQTSCYIYKKKRAFITLFPSHY